MCAVLQRISCCGRQKPSSASGLAAPCATPAGKAAVDNSVDYLHNAVDDWTYDQFWAFIAFRLLSFRLSIYRSCE